MSDLVDLGLGVQLRYVQWSPDRELNPQYEGLPDVEKYGANVLHFTSQGMLCTGHITFRSNVAKQIEPPGRAMWDVESWDPLTISPSVLCTQCGHHGWIRAGRWVSA